MTKEQFHELYLGKAVHCDTEEKAKEFLSLAHGFGYKWRSGTFLIYTPRWSQHMEETTYVLRTDKTVTFHNVDDGDAKNVVVKYPQEPKPKTLEQLIQNINKWATDKNLHTAPPEKQMLKLNEELGELASAMLKGNEPLILDSLGDMLVVITILHLQMGYTVEQTLNIAWNEIKDRKGKTENGVFKKNE